MMPTERPETLALRWPIGGQAPLPLRVQDRYSFAVGVNQEPFRRVQSAIGFEVTERVWAELSAGLIGDAMVLAVDKETGSPVATAVAEQREGWIELGWVAVAPAHRGKGLGQAVCHALVTHLLGAGRTRLFGSTQDHRSAALRIYLSLGFHPVLRPEKLQRWRAVCKQLGVPFTPERWA